jgi:prevent-host-death family protein
MKQIKVSEFKAKLSHFLRLVKKGQGLVIVDHNLPVARVSQITEDEEVEITIPSLSIKDVLSGMPALPPSDIATDSLAILVEERRRR